MSVGPDNEAIAIWSTPEGQARLASVTNQEGWATFPDSRAEGGRVNVHIATYGSGASHIIESSLQMAHATAQPLPGGEVLLVGARCRWAVDADEPEHNAVVVDPEGVVDRTAVFGDGIEHVLTSREGHIWIGYFDEGVYGNYGWGGPDRKPIGAAGLVQFSANLKEHWRFDGTDRGEWISDCYALNVERDVAWACYYTDFPVARVENGDVVSWSNDVMGARALVVGGSELALFSGYSGERDRVVVGSLMEDSFTAAGRGRLALPDGRELPPAAVFGRGADLHVFCGTHWYRTDLEAMAAAVK